MLFSIVEMESNAALADKASAVRPLSLLVVLFHSDLSTNIFVDPKFAISPHKSNGGECNRLITNKKQNI